MCHSRNKLALTAVAVLVASAQAAFAQVGGGGSSRPYGGLFGGTHADTSAKQSLSFLLSLAEGYNADTSPRLSTIVEPTAGHAGLQTMLVANGAYVWRGTNAQFAANAASVLAYYNDLSETRSLSHTIGVGFSAQLSQKASLLVNQSAAYSPSYLYSLFPGDETVQPGDEVPAAPEYAVQTRDTYFYTSSVGLSYGFTRRNKLSLSGDFNYADYLAETETQRDMRVLAGRTEFSRNVTRNTVLALAYRVRDGDAGFAFEPTIEQGVEIGFDHSRPLSATRRAFVGVRLGTSTMEVRPSTISGIAVEPGRRYFVEGQVSAGYEFARGSQVSAMYRRAMEYIPTLTEPVFTDGVSAGLEAMITQRLNLTIAGGYSNGKSAFTQDASALETYSGNTQFRYALNRSTAAYVQYLYYFYDFGGNAHLAPGMASRLERNAVRAGFMLWLPVVQR